MHVAKAVLAAAAQLAVRRSEASGAGKEDAQAATPQETLLPMRSLLPAAPPTGTSPPPPPPRTIPTTGSSSPSLRPPMLPNVVGACSRLLQATASVSSPSCSSQPPSSQYKHQRA
ncbi:hypothetical protein CLOP_g12874 [Closterium sp. NIES-67]|nr:hypothetical protein CLOP_g12874 [Closterium sp. NIES-67]